MIVTGLHPLSIVVLVLIDLYFIVLNFILKLAGVINTTGKSNYNIILTNEFK